MSKKDNKEHKCKSCGKILLDEEATYCNRCKQNKMDKHGAIAAATATVTAIGAVAFSILKNLEGKISDFSVNKIMEFP